jgi:hypothetical protein
VKLSLAYAAAGAVKNFDKNLPYHVVILPFRRPDDDNPERFSFVENHEFPYASAIHIAAVGDVVVIVGQHIGRVTARTLYELANERGLFLVTINALREATPPPKPPAH